MPVSGDRQRTLMRYEMAVTALKSSLQFDRTGSETFLFYELENVPEDEWNLGLLHNTIEGWLTSRKDAATDRGLWKKAEKLAEQLFTAMCPFAKNFLAIAKDIQGVCNPPTIMLTDALDVPC